MSESAEKENEPTEKMYAAIQELNEIEKSIVLLYLDSYSYEEMEKIMGTPNGALRVKMTRIKDKLKQSNLDAMFNRASDGM